MKEDLVKLNKQLLYYLEDRDGPARTRKKVEDMTDEEVLKYIQDKKEETFYDSWDFKRENNTDKLFQPGHYWLMLYSKNDNPIIPNPKTMVSLYRAGYSRYAAYDSVILAQCMGREPVACGNDLNLLEDWQRHLSKYGLKTEIIFSD